MPLKFPFLVRHSMTAPDRLGNPKCKFPIAYAFGDLDFFGSEGADAILRQNKEFATGRSQLFKVENCTHFMITDQPVKMFELMHGFFKGTRRGFFEPKPRSAQVIAAPHPKL